jgi:hypothetical protein
LTFRDVTEPLAIFDPVTAASWSCLVPTLPAGKFSAAYALPPSATNSAKSATIIADDGTGSRPLPKRPLIFVNTIDLFPTPRGNRNPIKPRWQAASQLPGRIL